MAKRKAVAGKKVKKKQNVHRAVARRKSKPRSKPRKKSEPKPLVKQIDWATWVKQGPALKLAVDLVPKTQWCKNLRKQVPRPVWDKLRKEVYAQAGFKCQICGAGGKLNCHEIWEYDDTNMVQRLKGFHAVCSMCHHVTHYGMASILASQGHLDLEEVVRHFMKVNGVSRKVFEKHFEKATTIWSFRSEFEWVLDYGQWATLLPEKPA